MNIMRVGIDVTGLFWKYRTGVQSLYFGLLEGLANLDSAGARFVLLDPSIQEIRHLGLALDRRFEFRSAVPLYHVPALGRFASMRFLGRGVRVWNSALWTLRRRMVTHSNPVEHILRDIDVLQVWNWDIMTGSRAKNVITIPDVIPLLFPESFPPEFIEATRVSFDFANHRAARVIAISEFTRHELERVAGIPADKITVIYPGVRPIFKPVGDDAEINAVQDRYGICDRPYILSVGYLDPRKNVLGHVRAFEQLAAEKNFRDFQLVLVGPESLATAQVLQALHSTQIRERVHVTGFIPDQHLVPLMNGASAFVYCSHYEGFGFPILEAMACNVPVVTSNSTSLKEIAGDAAICVDPGDVEAIADGIRSVLTDDTLHRELCGRGIQHAARFTWDKWALGHLQVYRECYQAG